MKSGPAAGRCRGGFTPPAFLIRSEAGDLSSLRSHFVPYCVCCITTPATTLLLSVLTMNIVLEFATYP
jgi:hypothetical protein